MTIQDDVVHPSDSSPRNLPSRDACMGTPGGVQIMFFTVLFSIAKSKRNEIMSFTATWMDLDVVILREVRQRNTNII